MVENYKGVFDNRIGFGKRPAMLLIDFVEAYFDKNCPLYANVEDNLASALRILDHARHADIPIIYTNVVYHENMADAGVFYKKVKVLENFKQGSPMGNWPKGLSPIDGERVISKQYPSAFFGTSLASTLAAQQIDSVIITGLTTSGCIRASCVDASSHGFIPIVVAEACGDRDEAPHQANLFDMNAKYADVISESDVIDYIKTL